MRFRSVLAIAAGRAGGAASRVLRLGGGTSLPGAIALKIDPGLIGTLAARLDAGSIIITATNGKTTTANMTAGVLAAAGLRPLHNAAGANLAYGVATVLMGGRPAGPGREIGLFEVDEAVVCKIVPELAPRVLAVGNIFRDQLDRFGEVDTTARLIGEGIAKLPAGARLVLNADDPRVAALGSDFAGAPVYFGIDDDRYVQSGPIGAQDSKDCLVCGGPLEYSRRYFSHLGHYSCPVCGFARPATHVVAAGLELGRHRSRFRLVTPDGERPVELAVPAVHNIYNALEAAAVGVACGVELDAIVGALQGFHAAFGRFEVVEVEGRRLHLMLIKNPTGFNQAIQALNVDPAPKNVMIAINDNLADGTDVSWLWDADLESLGPTNWLMAGGVRAHDMALRLKYAGFDAPDFLVEPDFDRALKAAVAATPPGDDVYILPTYTAMLQIRERLERPGGLPAFWRSGVGA